MRILKVIHGYPPYYSAGSEVYSQMLASALAENHEVQVFSRFENSFLSDFEYRTELDYLDPRILLHLINIPLTKYRYKFINEEVDNKFREILEEYKPNIVHFGHLNHLSMSLPRITKDLNIPSIYTLHDFWLMCPRGRFIKRNSEELLELCEGQENTKCAQSCYKGYFTGDLGSENNEIEYWSNWIDKRMEYTREATNNIDHFIAPSKFLMNKFVDEFGISSKRMTYLDYGFDLSRLGERKRQKEKEFVFGYIGTHTPEKGVDLLLKAFDKMHSKAILRIWGASRAETKELHYIENQLSDKTKSRIEWMGPYKNENILEDVFNKLDAIVVPSIWGENSPLVIHEAQQVRVPVITANYGGMSEYVEHKKNGLLFEHRNIDDLAIKMADLCNNQDLYKALSKTGYLYSDNGDVVSTKEHSEQIEKIYYKIAKEKNMLFDTKPGPWRITFDTNPDYCNYACVMCECFSEYSDVKSKKQEKGVKPKVMSIDLIRKVIEEAKDTPLREIIPSTMGEPLMYKHFDEIINMCHEFGLKLNLTTNGSFVVKGARKWAELLVPVLSDIKISWNGASKEVNDKIMKGSKWEVMLDNLKTFLEVREDYSSRTGKRCSVTLQMTFLETNLGDLYNLVDMSIDMGIDRVKGHHLWAHFDEIKDLSMRRNKDSIRRWNIEVQRLFKLRDTKLLPNGKKIKLENFTILDETAEDDIAPGGSCPFLGKEAWVNNEGKFSPCCAPDELRDQLGNFGNLNEQSMSDIWNSDKYKELQKNYLKFDLCKSCNMKKPLVG